MRILLTFLVYIVALNTVLFSQTGGENIFPFLDLDYSARNSSLGRNYIAVNDDDINLAVTNPSLLSEEMHNNIGFNQSIHAGGINQGMVVYGRNMFGGTGAVHLRYIAYGEMDRTDKTGEVIGTFSAGDFVLGAGFGKQINPRISVGGNFNVIWSQLEAFNSFGLAVDLGGTYHFEDGRTVASALVRNAGAQLTKYNMEDRAPTYANAMIGVTHKLEHAPFRLGIVAHNLNRWDLTYSDPNLEATTDPLSGELVEPETAGFGEKLGQHFIAQVEVVAGKSVRIRGAFDYHRRRSFVVENRPAMAGFSFGAGFNFKRFSIDYGLVVFSSAGFNNLITLTTNFDKWKNKAN